MRLVSALTRTAVLMVLSSAAVAVQGEPDRVVYGGGVTAKGWMGKIIDASSIQQGRTINDSKFAQVGSALILNIGPAAIYWNPANELKGDYTVRATFKETNYLKINSHPHPYGIFIAGNKLDTDKPSLFYCAPYGNGTFIVRGFKDGVPGGGAPKPHDKVNKADGPGGTVTQDVEINVKAGRVSCVINGGVVATFDKAQVVGPGKLDSTDGIAGIRVSHNLDVTITGWSAK